MSLFEFEWQTFSFFLKSNKFWSVIRTVMPFQWMLWDQTLQFIKFILLYLVFCRDQWKQRWVKWKELCFSGNYFLVSQFHDDVFVAEVRLLFVKETLDVLPSCSTEFLLFNYQLNTHQYLRRIKSKAQQVNWVKCLQSQEIWLWCEMHWVLRSESFSDDENGDDDVHANEETTKNETKLKKNKKQQTEQKYDVGKKLLSEIHVH